MVVERLDRPHPGSRSHPDHPVAVVEGGGDTRHVAAVAVPVDSARLAGAEQGQALHPVDHVEVGMGVGTGVDDRDVDVGAVGSRWAVARGERHVGARHQVGLDAIEAGGDLLIGDGHHPVGGDGHHVGVAR